MLAFLLRVVYYKKSYRAAVCVLYAVCVLVFVLGFACVFLACLCRPWGAGRVGPLPLFFHVSLLLLVYSFFVGQPSSHSVVVIVLGPGFRFWFSFLDILPSKQRNDTPKND